MAHKKTCRNCGDKYTPSEEEINDGLHSENICDECFEMQESSHGMPPDYEQYSDADSGL